LLAAWKGEQRALENNERLGRVKTGLEVVVVVVMKKGSGSAREGKLSGQKVVP